MDSILFPIISLGGLGLIFGVVLGFASKKFHVPVDDRVPLISECLPGANCGGCGFAGCDAYAQAIVEEGAAPNCCPVAGAAAAEKIGKIMGVEVNLEEPKKAYVKCLGSCKVAKKDGIYYGDMDCQEAAIISSGGAKACNYGCLGLQSCVKVCKFDAIYVVDGVAIVDDEKCTGCGACVNICPKGLIDLKTASEVIRVACNSRDKLKEVKDACSVGCMTCGMCVRNCPNEAITMVDNIPVIDKEKCNLCGICVQKCPTKIIKAYGQEIKVTV